MLVLVTFIVGIMFMPVLLIKKKKAQKLSDLSKVTRQTNVDPGFESISLSSQPFILITIFQPWLEE